ncbi:MAG TPA: hypothetical protein VLZ03_11140 [Thermodesulfobacteriota bacterium]|nr:hypothetical protein [Thermodesulfobacteriota bacterium]
MRKIFIWLLTSLAFMVFATIVIAGPPRATVEYQPMTSHGLAAGLPFEAWIVFDKSPNPAEPGYALPAGTTFRFTFPDSFTPQPNVHPESVLLYDWPQRAAPVPFTIGLDPQDPRTVVLKLKEAFPAGPPERPGLKAIHLRWGPVNPAREGDYPITIQISDAGALSGTTQAVAHITSKPVPVVAAYNQLHESRNEDWQHVKTGQRASLPIDLLITLPDKARSSMELRPVAGENLEVLADGVAIGTITRRGVEVTLKPEPFGPGFARLGIVRFYVTGGFVPGLAEIVAQLQGGPPYMLHVFIEQ